MHLRYTPADQHSYRGTSLIKNHPLLGPYSRPMPRTLRWSYGGGLFFMSEVPLYARWQGVWCVSKGFGGEGVVHRVSASLLSPVDPSFRALSGRIKFTVRRYKFDKDSLPM